MNLSEVKQYLSEFIEENGFDGLYDEEVSDYVRATMDEPAIWNPIKHWLRASAKKDPDSSAGFIDDWVKTLFEPSAHDEESGPFFQIGDHVEIAANLAERVEAVGEVIFDLNAFYQYRDGAVWERIREQDLTRVISDFSGAPVASGSNKPPSPLRVSSGMIDGVIRIYRDHVDRSGNESGGGFFDSAPPGIMFSDVFMRVDLAAKCVITEEPSPEHRQPINAGCSFDGPTDTPLFDAYIDSIFLGDPDPKGKARLLLEFAGACMANIATRMQRALILYDATDRSTGANGKSVFIKILNEIFPASARSSISPVEFSEKFTRAMLAGKRINFVTEMPDEYGVISGETTKAIITGEPIKAEHKNQAPFFFSPTAGHVFACNDFPSVSDNSEAFWRRWMVVPFNRTFGPGDADPDMVKKIVENERDAMMRRIALALDDLVRRGRYDIPAECDAAFNVWKRDSDSVLQFLSEESHNYRNGGYIEEAGAPIDVWMLSGDLFSRYRSWAEFWGMKPYGKNRFGRRCTKLLEKRRTGAGQEYRISLRTKAFGSSSNTTRQEGDIF